MATTNLSLDEIVSSDKVSATIPEINSNWAKIDAFAGTIPVKTQLFSGSSQGTIALSDSAANYDSIIIYCDTDDDYDIPAVETSNGRTVTVSSINVGSSFAALKSAWIQVSGTSVTVTDNRQWYLPTNAIQTGKQPIYVTRVIGVKNFG